MIEVPEFLKPLERVTSPFPREAVEEALARREEVTPHLLGVLESVAVDPAAVPVDYIFHEYAIFLLAQFREERALEGLTRLARHAGASELLGDLLTEYFGRILASVSAGNTGPILELVQDGEADEFARNSGLRALGAIYEAGLLTRENFSGYLGVFFCTLPKDESFVWTGLCDVCADFGFKEHAEAIQKAWDDGQVDPCFDSLDSLLSRASRPHIDNSGKRSYRLISDVVAEMSGWHCFKDRATHAGINPQIYQLFEKEVARKCLPPRPLRVEPKPGRNDPCPCGSGKKHKKCCG